MRYPNRLLKFKNPDDAWNSEYLTFKFIHCNYLLTLFQSKCNKEEIESALYGKFIEDRIKERKYIISIQWETIKLVKKIMKKVKNDKTM